MSLAAAGHLVVAADVNVDGANVTAEQARAAGGWAVGMMLDVAEQDSWTSMVATVERDVGPITTLVNNAAIKASVAPLDRGLLELDLETWDRIMAVNLRGAMLGTKATIPGMLDQARGSIVMMSSVGSMRATPNFGIAYGTAKAALNGLALRIAVSFGPRGIRCNAIAPGHIVDEHAPRQGPATWTQGLLPRSGLPADVAAAVRFLASDDAAYINGQVLAIDGGLTSLLPGLQFALGSSDVATVDER